MNLSNQFKEENKMRDLNNLNREHNDKLKKILADVNKKDCCRCTEGQEHIFCGCDCHKPKDADND
jgi:hypothetical protein